MIRCFTTALAFLVFSFAGSAFAGKHKFHNFDVAGARETFVAGINDSNDIAGSWQDQASISHGYIRTPDGNIITFDVPGAASTAISAINSNNMVVGSFNYPSDLPHGFLRTPDATIAVIDPPNAMKSSAQGINREGEISGNFQDTGGRIYGFVRTAGGKYKIFDAAAGALTVTGLINDNGVVTGGYCVDGSCKTINGYVRAADGTIATFTVAGAQVTDPSAINSDGLVAGISFDPNGIRSGFLRTPEGQITISQCGFAGLNNRGWAVGSVKLDGSYHGCIRSPDGTETTFDDPKAGGGALQGTAGSDITKSHYVGGQYQDSDGNFHGFIVYRPK